MKTLKILLLNLTEKNSDMNTIPTKTGPLSAARQTFEAGLAILNEFRWAAATLAILLTSHVQAQAPRVAATVVEASLPAATRVAAIEAIEKTAGAVVSRNVSSIVADSAAQAASRRAATTATRQAGFSSIEATGNALARPDRSKEILAVGTGIGLGTGIHSAMSQTGAGIESGLTELGRGAGAAVRETPKSIPFLTAASAVVVLVFLFLISRLIPRRRPTEVKVDHRKMR